MVSEIVSVKVARILGKNKIPPKTRDIASGQGILSQLKEILSPNRWENRPATSDEIERVAALYRGHPILRNDFAEMMTNPMMLGEIRAVLHEKSKLIMS